MSAEVFYRGGGFEVNRKLLRTPRKSYAIGQIEYVSVHRPLLAFVIVPAVGLAGFTFAFWRYLYTAEIATLIAGSVVVVILAMCFGALRVHSLALRDDEVAMNFGRIGRLREVRAAVEPAMAERVDRRDGE